MRITRLVTTHYRTLEDLELSFPSFYSAICGRNDSGKTNVVRAIRCLMKTEERLFPTLDEPEFSLKQDYTRWLDGDPKARFISVGIQLRISAESDAGLFQFFQDYLGLTNLGDELELSVNVTHRSDSTEVEVTVQGEPPFHDLKAQEVLKKLQTSLTFLFHSSTDPLSGPWLGLRPRARGVLGEISEGYAGKLEQSKKSLDSVLRQIARERQREIEELLGRLSDRYRVGLTIPTLDIRYFPFDLTLGDRNVEVELEQWGSRHAQLDPGPVDNLPR